MGKKHYGLLEGPRIIMWLGGFFENEIFSLEHCWKCLMVGGTIKISMVHCRSLMRLEQSLKVSESEWTNKFTEGNYTRRVVR